MSQYSVCPDPSYFSDSYEIREHPADYDPEEISGLNADELAWDNGDERADAELPAPSMEDERRALLLAAELERLARQSDPEPEDELEYLRRGPVRQQGSFEFEYSEVA